MWVEVVEEHRRVEAHPTLVRRVVRLRGVLQAREEVVETGVDVTEETDQPDHVDLGEELDDEPDQDGVGGVRDTGCTPLGTTEARRSVSTPSLVSRSTGGFAPLFSSQPTLGLTPDLPLVRGGTLVSTKSGRRRQRRSTPVYRRLLTVVVPVHPETTWVGARPCTEGTRMSVERWTRGGTRRESVETVTGTGGTVVPGRVVGTVPRSRSFTRPEPDLHEPPSSRSDLDVQAPSVHSRVGTKKG